MKTVTGIVAAVLLVATASLWPAAPQIRETRSLGPALIRESHHDVSPPLRDMVAGAPIVSALNRQGEPLQGNEANLQLPRPPVSLSSGNDTVVQQSAPLALQANVGANFPGVPANNFSPAPDTNGAAGATQFVQWVNLQFAVFDKSSGAKLLGPALGNTLWAGFGGPCEAQDSGDIVAQYDKAAQRWVMTQHATPAGGPYLQCVAVSTTPDATGTFNRYSFQLTNVLSDYPKLGVWSDAYYVSINAFDLSTGQFVNAVLCALDRSAMLNDAAASAQCFSPPTPAFSFLPSDIDGTTPPPSGSPDYFLNLGSNSLNLWKFHVDFANPANSTFRGPTNIPVAGFSLACGGNVCIPQLDTTQQLDSLGDRLMYRLAYRNFTDHESLVVAHSVGSPAGIRWYELRNPAGTPVVFQQGTYAPDANDRWMPSAAMDQSGDIAVGYSVSSSSMHPAMRFTGRLFSDPPGTLEAESSIIEGAGSQQSGDNRWGDYSSMALDPSDDCTFWFTSEYIPVDGTLNWNTRIASFRFPSCAAPAPVAQLSLNVLSFGNQEVGTTSSPQTVTITNGGSGGLTVSQVAASAAFSQTNNCISSSPIAPKQSCAVNISFSPGSAGNISGALTVSDNAPSAGSRQNVALSGNGTDFSLAAANGGSTSATIRAGQQATYSLQAASIDGFADSVNLSCSGTPSGFSCSVPAGVTLNGSGNAPFTVTISSATQAAPATGAAASGMGRAASPHSLAWLPESATAVGMEVSGGLAALLLALAAITLGFAILLSRARAGRALLWGQPARSAWRASLRYAVFAAMIFLCGCVLMSCGFGTSSGSFGSSNSNAASLTITGTTSSGLRHTLGLTLTIQQ